MTTSTGNNMGEKRVKTGVLGHNDAQLIADFRNNVSGSDERLYTTYREDALVAARAAAPDHDTAEDFVAEAFTRVFDLMRRGKGPTDSFRYYLRAAIRSIALDWYRSRAKNVTISDFEQFDPILAENTSHNQKQYEEIDLDTDGEVVAAYKSLPERSRSVLFYKAVEDRSNAEIAELMGLSLNTVAVTYHRAKDGLRKGYLTEIAKERSSGGDPECQSYASELANLALDDIPPTKLRKLRRHMAHCQRCKENAGELEFLAKRFDKKSLSLAIAGVAGSVALPGLGTATRSAALVALLTSSPFVAAGIVALIVLAIATPFAVQAAQGDGSESEVIEIRDTGNAAGGACRVEFTLNSARAGRATLTTSSTGGQECRMQAWLDGDQIVAPFDITSSQVTVISRSGALRVELSSGEERETRTFTIPK
ncbi:sigma-70 family RNA polymerase sigma factor [Leucobacter insecticola]|uniref:Sigma-70 family RNA polymerase sigma factor n=1 Tax=Leucobacter insecticola TaxID=2714934 RepID=A0A6G8FHS7_9MICO|nr:sigma-70 family RNA polymerase sigma factor [Leucobacter insecticola]QIM15908.1 sigma-70 family RNA polymerase sigma factor [Leucobacter insecticola]